MIERGDTMRVFVYGHQREEEVFFDMCRKKFNMEIMSTHERPTLGNANLCSGCACISVLSSNIDRKLILKFYEIGVRFISTRTVGYDHIDLETAKEIGMHIGNATYAPQSVADYTIMLILMTLRKMKLIMQSSMIQDYSFTHVQGRNLKGKVVGVIGTGNIGQTLIHHLANFECKIIAYAHYPSKDMEKYVTYVDFETLLQQSDIISLHVPLNTNNYHMLDATAFSKMKEGVVIINTSRGALIHNEALISAIESSKVSGAALDVVEGEEGIYYRNCKARILQQRDMAILNAFPNVILSPHMAFLTEESTHDMVMDSMQSCYGFMHGEQHPRYIL